MNKEKKFRVWDKKNKEWLHNWEFLITSIGTVLYVGDEGKFENENNRFKIQQFAGVKDRYGKDVFEGDIVERTYDFTKTNKPKKTIQEIILDKGHFKFYRYYRKTGAKGYSMIYDGHKVFPFRILGNIYENFKLLK